MSVQSSFGRGPSEVGSFRPLAEFIEFAESDGFDEPDAELLTLELENGSRILADAEEIVDDRENKHGTPAETHRRIGRLWEAYLDLPTGTIDSHDAAVMLGLLKDARIRENPSRRDSWVDRAGYVDCGWRCVEEEEEDRR